MRRLLTTAVALIGIVAEEAPAQVPEYDPLFGQDFGGAAVSNRMGLWQMAWEPREEYGRYPRDRRREDPGPIRWYLGFSARPNFIFQGRSFLQPIDYGKLEAFKVALPDTSFVYSVAIGESARCGHAALSLNERPNSRGLSVRANLPERTGEIVTPYPICGQRMIGMVEERDGVRYQTCVDRAYAVAESVSQLTLMFHDGLLEWALSPVPFHPDMEDGDTAESDNGPWWPVPETCHPLFRERAASELPAPRENAAFAMTWGAPDALESLQIWQDDRETGSFFLFYDDGRLMTQGYRDDGLPHGLWWYFGRDGTLVEARLYALGVELERLPVKTEYKREPPL